MVSRWRWLARFGRQSKDVRSARGGDTTCPPTHHFAPGLQRVGMLSLGAILYVGILLINAIAILSEDRFLARSTQLPRDVTLAALTIRVCMVQLAGHLHNKCSKAMHTTKDMISPDTAVPVSLTLVSKHG